MNKSSALIGQLLAVKSLKIIFRNFFLTLTNHKLIFVNCKSVSVMTGPSSFLVQTNFIWLAVLSTNYWINDFNDTRSHFFLIFVVFSYYWVLLNSLSKY